MPSPNIMPEEPAELSNGRLAFYYTALAGRVRDCPDFRTGSTARVAAIVGEYASRLAAGQLADDDEGCDCAQLVDVYVTAAILGAVPHWCAPVPADAVEAVVAAMRRRDAHRAAG